MCAEVVVWSHNILVELIILQKIKEFPSFYGKRTFLAV
jgi:hypothetical protein